MTEKFRKRLVKGILLVLVMFASSCGSAADNETLSDTVGPKSVVTSTTTYQFTLTVTPSAVASGGSALWSVHVWDSINPTGAKDVSITFTGGGLSTAVIVLTDANGNASTSVDISGNAGASVAVTAVVENNGAQSLTVPAIILP